MNLQLSGGGTTLEVAKYRKSELKVTSAVKKRVNKCKHKQISEPNHFLLHAVSFIKAPKTRLLVRSLDICI